MKKIRIGVIGVGYLGQFHAEKYAKMPDAELVGVVDTEPVRRDHIADKLGIRGYKEPAELVGKVDAVSIVVPTILHHAIAHQFLKANTHVLLEKPITVTIEEADDLISLAERNGVVLQIGHIERFNPAFISVKERIRSPHYMTVERAAPFTVRCTDVNVVLDLMIHDLDIVSDLAASEPKEVSAAGAAVITKEIDIATARIIFRNGCIADVTASRVSDAKKRLLRVFDGDSMFVSDFQSQSTVASDRSDKKTELVLHDISSERRDTLDEEIRSFIKCVRDGIRPLVSGLEGRKALALARLITEHIERGISGFMPMP